MSNTGKVLRERSFDFAIRIVQLSKYLENEKKDWTLSKQLLRSGTSIGANIREARFAQSTADFVSKLSIALKEAEETGYWLELLLATDIIDKSTFGRMQETCDWLIGTLVNVIKAKKRTLVVGIHESKSRRQTDDDDLTT